MLLVDAAHQRGGGRQDLVDEDEDGLLGRQLDALADDVDELADGQVRGDEVLLLVDGRDVALLDLFADNLCSRGMLCQRLRDPLFFQGSRGGSGEVAVRLARHAREKGEEGLWRG